ncbi:hypothetical protein C8J57DRAFT_1220489 [Mycena rebaudengoi]|nr:hypothetical protein C8J57DRAFT_1220489 [Mycena rebaudengoi]
MGGAPKHFSTRSALAKLSVDWDLPERLRCASPPVYRLQVARILPAFFLKSTTPTLGVGCWLWNRRMPAAIDIRIPPGEGFCSLAAGPHFTVDLAHVDCSPVLKCKGVSGGIDVGKRRYGFGIFLTNCHPESKHDRGTFSPQMRRNNRWWNSRRIRRSLRPKRTGDESYTLKKVDDGPRGHRAVGSMYAGDHPMMEFGNCLENPHSFTEDRRELGWNAAWERELAMIFGSGVEIYSATGPLDTKPRITASFLAGFYDQLLTDSLVANDFETRWTLGCSPEQHEEFILEGLARTCEVSAAYEAYRE